MYQIYNKFIVRNQDNLRHNTDYIALEFVN